MDRIYAVYNSTHRSFHPYKRFDGGREAVGHELELAVGRDEGDGTVVLEAREADTLVELDVLHLDRLAPRRCTQTSAGPRTHEAGGARTAAGALEHDLVVQAEPELGHAGEVALHLDCAEDLGAYDVTVCVDLQQGQ